jgi:uncharacterized protein YkwD
MRRPVLLVGAVGLITLVGGVVVATTANAGTSTYEAESATNTRTGGARPVGCKRCSGGTRIGWLGRTGALTFNGVAAERAGSTTVSVTYSSPRRRTALLSVNGGTSTAISFPSTRSFGRPATVRVKVTLRAGTNTLSFGNPSGGAPDLDKLVVATDGTPPAPIPTATITGPPITAEPTAAPTATPIPTGEPTAVPTTSPTTGAPTDPPSSPGTPGPTATARPTTPAPTVPTAPPTTAPPTGNAALEAAVVDLVNARRAEAGCPAVRSDDKLTIAARAHSADMAARNYFSHDTLEGVKFSTRITNAGYRWSGAGENIAKGQRTPAEVMTGWMNSPGHRANILNCGFKDLGVGVAADSYGSLLWTQDFASPANW